MVLAGCSPHEAQIDTLSLHEHGNRHFATDGVGFILHGIGGSTRPASNLRG